MHLQNAEALHQQELLAKWVSNRHHIELQIADYGDAPPIHLINLRHYIYKQIRQCKKQLKRLKKTIKESNYLVTAPIMLTGMCKAFMY